MTNWPWNNDEKTLLSPEHWEAVLSDADQYAESAQPIRNRKTERLWADAYAALQRSDRERAIDLFQQCAAAEPGLADAYLALFGLLGDDEQICQALAVTAPRLREYQRRFEQKLNTRYTPLYFASVLLASPDDARLAYARYLSVSGQIAGATAWTARCKQTDTRTIALLARISLDEGRWQDAAAYFQQVISLDDELRADAQLGLAFALEQLGFDEGARSSFVAAADLAPTEKARRYCRYRLALTHERMGEQAKARRILEQIYAEDVDYLDVAERLGAGSTVVSQTTPDGGLDPFEAIVANLEAGRLATDPAIADNNQQLS
jgi:tetratricopeptide (TPR) repeat protein